MLAAIEHAYVTEPVGPTTVDAIRERVGEWIAAVMKRLSLDRLGSGRRPQTLR
jgi:hypothetical protein